MLGPTMYKISKRENKQMNIKLEKVGIWKNFLMVHHVFCEKSCGFFTGFQINGIFKTLEKVGKKSSKKLKIKNRENQFVFEFE